MAQPWKARAISIIDGGYPYTRIEQVHSWQPAESEGSSIGKVTYLTTQEEKRMPHFAEYNPGENRT